jgi:hypothetical protein
MRGSKFYEHLFLCLCLVFFFFSSALSLRAHADCMAEKYREGRNDILLEGKQSEASSCTTDADERWIHNPGDISETCYISQQVASVRMNHES